MAYAAIEDSLCKFNRTSGEILLTPYKANELFSLARIKLTTSVNQNDHFSGILKLIVYYCNTNDPVCESLFDFYAGTEYGSTKPKVILKCTKGFPETWLRYNLQYVIRSEADGNYCYLMLNNIGGRGYNSAFYVKVDFATETERIMLYDGNTRFTLLSGETATKATNNVPQNNGLNKNQVDDEINTILASNSKLKSIKLDGDGKSLLSNDGNYLTLTSIFNNSDLTSKINSLSKTVFDNNFSESIRGTTTSIDNLKLEVDSFKSQTNTTISTLNTNCNTYNTSINTLKDRVDKLESNGSSSSTEYTNPTLYNFCMFNMNKAMDSIYTYNYIGSRFSWFTIQNGIATVSFNFDVNTTGENFKKYAVDSHALKFFPLDDGFGESYNDGWCTLGLPHPAPGCLVTINCMLPDETKSATLLIESAPDGYWGSDGNPTGSVKYYILLRYANRGISGEGFRGLVSYPVDSRWLKYREKVLSGSHQF